MKNKVEIKFRIAEIEVLKEYNKDNADVIEHLELEKYTLNWVLGESK